MPNIFIDPTNPFPRVNERPRYIMLDDQLGLAALEGHQIIEDGLVPIC